ncbi:MAG TPA: alpha/beta hydrolase [Streptosporangiaceae bacterium]|jgi:pimeloyl-ACP methyl ester carboxylesterase|nr:alpha/beta hydrolase [Streptosporangiaceae bacterium]
MTTADQLSRPGGDPSVPLGGHSRWIDIDGPVRYLDFGGPADGPVLVCVHGLGGSATNWMAIAPLLTGRYRMIAPDLAGHGLTRSSGRGAGVSANRALLHRFITATCSGPVILVGNSMGGMIALLETVEAPQTVVGLILLDPALPLLPVLPGPLVLAMFALYITPGLGSVLMSRRRGQSAEAVVASVLEMCCADPSRVPPDVVAQHVALVKRRGAITEAERDFAQATRSVVATVGYVHGRAYRRGIRSITCPVLLLHGGRDRLVPAAAARAAARRNPSWSVMIFPDVGHVPQLEAPQETATAITQWLAAAGEPAAAAATPAAATPAATSAAPPAPHLPI